MFSLRCSGKYKSQMLTLYILKISTDEKLFGRKPEFDVYKNNLFIELTETVLIRPRDSCIYWCEIHCILVRSLGTMTIVTTNSGLS